MEEPDNDHLVTAVVHFEVTAPDAETADVEARRLLSEEVEESPLFGDGRLATLRVGEVDGDQHVYHATAIVRFRQIGENWVEALETGQARLDQETAKSGLLSCGGTAYAEID